MRRLVWAWPHGGVAVPGAASRGQHGAACGRRERPRCPPPCPPGMGSPPSQMPRPEYPLPPCPPLSQVSPFFPNVPPSPCVPPPRVSPLPGRPLPRVSLSSLDVPPPSGGRTQAGLGLLGGGPRGCSLPAARGDSGAAAHSAWTLPCRKSYRGKH